VLSDKDMQHQIAQLGQASGAAGAGKEHIKAVLIELLPRLDSAPG